MTQTTYLLTIINRPLPLTLCSLLLLLLLLIGCNGSTLSNEGSLSEPPLIQLVVKGTPTEGVAGSSCWSSGAEPGLCVDIFEPTLNESLVIPAGEPLQFEFEAPLPTSASFVLRDANGETVVAETVMPTTTTNWPASLSAGTYTLLTSGQWPQGDASYWFSITIE